MQGVNIARSASCYHFPNSGDNYGGDINTGLSGNLNDGRRSTVSQSGDGHGTNNFVLCVLPQPRVISSIKYVPDTDNPQRSLNIKAELFLSTYNFTNQSSISSFGGQPLWAKTFDGSDTRGTALDTYTEIPQVCNEGFNETAIISDYSTSARQRESIKDYNTPKLQHG